MTYRIVIEKTEEVVKTAGQQWEVVGQVEKPRERSMFSSTANEPRTYITNEYGYTPEIKKALEVTTKVYEQTVEDLDLAEVILAINQINTVAASPSTGEDKPF